MKHRKVQTARSHTVFPVPGIVGCYVVATEYDCSRQNGEVGRLSNQ